MSDNTEIQGKIDQCYGDIDWYESRLNTYKNLRAKIRAALPKLEEAMEYVGKSSQALLMAYYSPNNSKRVGDDYDSIAKRN